MDKFKYLVLKKLLNRKVFLENSVFIMPQISRILKKTCIFELIYTVYRVKCDLHDTAREKGKNILS